MKLSIIIPVYNEQQTIGEVLRKVREVDLGDIEKEIVLVDWYCFIAALIGMYLANRSSHFLESIMAKF